MKIDLLKNGFLLIFLTFACVVMPVESQTGREVLTNAKIIELVRLGLDDEIIAEKVRQSDCQCDTSTDALARLKAAKVSNAVIMAMMEANRGFSDSKPAKPEKQADAVLDAGPKELRQVQEPGIYLFEDGKMTVIEPTVFSGGKVNPLGTILTYGIKKTKFRAKIRGASANLKSAASQPVFYFVFNPEYKNSGATMAGSFWGMPATSPNEFLMVQMKVKSASREAVLGEYGYWTGTEYGARDADVREYSFEKIKAGIYKVVPKTSLSPGEYAFYFASNVSGLGFAGGKIFDFSITR